jgi:hypothetical protein
MTDNTTGLTPAAMDAFVDYVSRNFESIVQPS